MKPLLFVDIDGVLSCPNATNAAQPTHTLRWPAPNPHQRVRIVDGQIRIERVDEPTEDDRWISQSVWVPDGAIDRLGLLAEVFDCVWATSWRLSGPAAWSSLLAHDPAWPSLAWEGLKLPAIVEFAGDQPWAFIDDDIAMELRDAGPLPDSPSHLLVETDSSVGITDAHVDELLSFAAALR